MATKQKETKTTGKTVKSNATQKVVDKKEESKQINVKEIDTNQIIPVYNGYQGKLIYRSSRTREKFVWEVFGDIQELELRELRNAKSSAKEFFAKNYFMFNDEYAWVIDYLGVNQYYKNALSVDNFDDIFKMSPEKVKSTVSKLSKGQKKSVSYRARQLIQSKEIDSIKVIAALEEALGEELTER